MRIALDFDGVLHDDKHPEPGRRMGPPIEGALHAVEKLIQHGHSLCVFTIRANGNSHVSDWFAYHGFPDLFVMNSKPDADLYVDDKGLRFYDWEQVLADLMLMLDAR